MRAARSVLAAELYVFMTSFDVGIVIQHALEDMFGREAALKKGTDSKCLFNALT